MTDNTVLTFPFNRVKAKRRKMIMPNLIMKKKVLNQMQELSDKRSAG